jgi:hypothetical protein
MPIAGTEIRHAVDQVRTAFGAAELPCPTFACESFDRTCKRSAKHHQVRRRQGLMPARGETSRRRRLDVQHESPVPSGETLGVVSKFNRGLFVQRQSNCLFAPPAETFFIEDGANIA